MAAEDPTPVSALPPPTGQSPVWPDQPAAPPRTGRRRWPQALFWGGIALMVFAAVFGLADWAARTYELTQLLDRAEASEQTMIRYQERARAVELPDDPDEADRERAEEELMAAAAESLPEVEAAGGQVAAISFLPWHGELVEAQAAYLAHNRAWVDHLRRGSDDVSSLLSDDLMIDSTWETAEMRIRAAEPWPTWPAIRQRVDAIFAPAPTEEPSDSGVRV